MRYFSTKYVLLLVVLLASCARGSLQEYRSYLTDPKEVTPDEGDVTVTFFGVSTMVISDGETSLMVDGFLSRPEGLRWLNLRREVSPSVPVITETLRRGGIDRLDAVLVTHTHPDHVLDAPEIARQTRALLVGSRSALNVGRGWRLPEDQMREVVAGQPMQLGDFAVTFVRSRHASAFCGGDPIGDGEVIDEVLEMPASWSEFHPGITYSLYISHPLGALIVHPSAGYLEGMFDGYRADVVFLGLGRVGNYDRRCQEAYFHEVVEVPGASTVIPIHWDDYTRPLDEPLRPSISAFNDFQGAMSFLIEQRRRGAFRDLMLLRSFQEVVLFDG